MEEGKKNVRWPCKSDHSRKWALVLLMMGCIQVGCASLPERWPPSHRIDPAQMTHAAFHNLLQVSVRDGQVDYPAFQADPQFGAYLAQLDRIDPRGLDTDADRLAFWINAYNAFAIKGILDGLTPAPYLGWYRYFKARDYVVGGARVNLYDLEHEILRKQFQEPRVHFAIVCASISCPALQPWAYEGTVLDRQLDEAARRFVNDPAKNRFDPGKRVAALSKIFDWFEEDFAAAGSVQQFLARYVEDAELARGLRDGLYRVEYLEYDWSLNGIGPRR